MPSDIDSTQEGPLDSTKKAAKQKAVRKLGGPMNGPRFKPFDPPRPDGAAVQDSAPDGRPNGTDAPPGDVPMTNGFAHHSAEPKESAVPTEQTSKQPRQPRRLADILGEGAEDTDVESTSRDQEQDHNEKTKSLSENDASSGQDETEASSETPSKEQAGLREKADVEMRDVSAPKDHDSEQEEDEGEESSSESSD